LLLRLKQLYDKFDDVVASGRMIAKMSDATDASASSSLTNGKMNKQISMRLDLFFDAIKSSVCQGISAHTHVCT